MEPLDVLEEPARVELPVDGHGGSRGQRRHGQEGKAHNVEHRRDVEDLVHARQRQGGDHDHGIGCQALVGEGSALRRSGCPRGAGDQDRGTGIELRVDGHG